MNLNSLSVVIGGGGGRRSGMKLFDAHCHLQDPRIYPFAPQILRSTIDTGVVNFAVNGTCEQDWDLVKQMSDSYPSVVPCFGVHPWCVQQTSPDWFTVLRRYFESTPCAAVGEIGLDKGSKGKPIDFSVQVDVCRKQLELAKELKRPVSVHCVRAFGDLLDVMQSTGPFPAGVILHSFLGSPEMVPRFANLGGYFSFSGFLMGLKLQKARKLVKSVPFDRILVETDAPDALPSGVDLQSLFIVESDHSLPRELQEQRGAMLNHPANIHNVLGYVASLLEMSKDELAEVTYSNSVRLFSYEGSKVQKQGSTVVIDSTA